MLNAIYWISDSHPDLWRRYLAILLDGLRADDRPALPVPGLDVTSFTSALAAPSKRIAGAHDQQFL